MKHPVVTVMKKRSKEPNYGQIYIFSNKYTMTTKTNHIGHKIENDKNRKYYILGHIGTPCVTTKTMSRNNNSGQDPGNWNQLHTTLSHTASIKSSAIYLTTGGASSRPSRKELKLHHIYCRHNLMFPR